MLRIRPSKIDRIAPDPVPRASLFGRLTSGHDRSRPSLDFGNLCRPCWHLPFHVKFAAFDGGPRLRAGIRLGRIEAEVSKRNSPADLATVVGEVEEVDNHRRLAGQHM